MPEKSKYQRRLMREVDTFVSRFANVLREVDRETRKARRAGKVCRVTKSGRLVCKKKRKTTRRK